MTVEWFGGKVEKAIKKNLDTANKEIAKKVMADAKSKLKRDADTTTGSGLTSQFDIRKSKFKDGGMIVSCQMFKWHKPYHAGFVELGNVWIHPYGNKNAKRVRLPAIPFLRPSTKANKRSAKKKWQEALK